MASLADRPVRQPPKVDVVCDPEIMGGMPTISGTRILAETVLLYIKDGDDLREIYSHYPWMPFGGIDAVKRWARETGQL